MIINDADLRKLVERIMELTLELAESNKKDVLLVIPGDDVESLKALSIHAQRRLYAKGQC